MITATYVILMILVLDGIWLTVMKPKYSSLVRGVQRSPMQINKVGAILSYLCVIGSLLVFGIPGTINSVQKKKMSPITAALINGGLLGLFIYGIFNFTNLAIFANYNWNMAIIDTLWGTFLYTLTCFVYVVYVHRF